jgi:hypothetical protein
VIDAVSREHGRREELASDARATVDRIKAFGAKLPKGRWILGGNWDHENWKPNNLPTAANGATTGINFTQALNFNVSNPVVRDAETGRRSNDVLAYAYEHTNEIEGNLAPDDPRASPLYADLHRLPHGCDQPLCCGSRAQAGCEHRCGTRDPDHRREHRQVRRDTAGGDA